MGEGDGRGGGEIWQLAAKSEMIIVRA